MSGHGSITPEELNRRIIDATKAAGLAVQAVTADLPFDLSYPNVCIRLLAAAAHVLGPEIIAVIAYGATAQYRADAALNDNSPVAVNPKGLH